MAPKFQHSVISPSKSDRWIACPGSALAEVGYPDKASPYTIEGTVAHRLGEKCLISGKDAAESIGKDLLLENGKATTVTVEMAAAVQVYLDHVRGLVASIPGATLEVEQKFRLDWINDQLSGTCDAVVAQHLGQLHIVDYKHGSGVVVDAEENTQMMIYGLGALGKPWEMEDYESVVLHIVQPRAARGGDAVKSWEIPVAALREFGASVKECAKQALKPNAPRVAGEHCHWCKAAVECPVLKQQATLGAVATFESVEEKLPPVEIISPEKLAAILERLPSLEKFAKAVRERAFGLAMQGITIPGYKLVAAVTHRRWGNDAELALDVELGKDAFETKLKSVAQVEKLAKTRKIDISGYIVKPAGAPTLAPATDKRQELTAVKPEDIFTAEAEQE
jgi:hypothetical protein